MVKSVRERTSARRGVGAERSLSWATGEQPEERGWWDTSETVWSYFMRAQNQAVILLFMKSCKMLLCVNRMRDLGKSLEDAFECKH